MGVKTYKKLIENFLYPKDYSCIFCKWPTERSYICNECLINLKEINSYKNHRILDEVLGVHYIYNYSGYAVEFIKRLKYKADFRVGEYIARRMSDYIENSNLKIDLITYVPMHRGDEKKRGYNQAKVIAKYLSDYTGIECVNTLKKVRKTKDQIGLSKMQRLDNLLSTFECEKGVNIENKNILIVDDVVTTGSTMYYCYKKLKKFAPSSITILTSCTR